MTAPDRLWTDVDREAAAHAHAAKWGLSAPRAGDYDMAEAVLDAVVPLITARVREQVAQTIEVAQGDRCPTCWGKAASTRWQKGFTKSGRCGAGHVWETDARDFPAAANVARYNRTTPEAADG